MMLMDSGSSTERLIVIAIAAGTVLDPASNAASLQLTAGVERRTQEVVVSRVVGAFVREHGWTMKLSKDPGGVEPNRLNLSALLPSAENQTSLAPLELRVARIVVLRNICSITGFVQGFRGQSRRHSPNYISDDRSGRHEPGDEHRAPGVGLQVTTRERGAKPSNTPSSGRE